MTLSLSLRRFSCIIVFLLSCSCFTQAQTFEKQMAVARADIERRYKCECLSCLPAVTKTMQPASDRNIIARGYRDIAVLLWYCNDRFSNGFPNALTATGALRYSLMFRSTSDALAMLDSMSKPENGLYFNKDEIEWGRIDSPWSGKILTAAAEGGAYLLESGEAEARQLCLKTDTGWISTWLPSEGWEKTGTLEYMRSKTGKSAALLVEYGQNSYGSGGGTTWHEAFLLDLRTLQIVYRQSTGFETEVFCGKYGEDPGCVRTPCAIEHPVSIKNNRLVIGKVNRTNYQQGEDCSLGHVSLSFINEYGESPPGLGRENIPVEYVLPGPLPGKYKFERGCLLPAE